jgi:hypothetical protein
MSDVCTFHYLNHLTLEECFNGCPKGLKFGSTKESEIKE